MNNIPVNTSLSRKTKHKKNRTSWRCIGHDLWESFQNNNFKSLREFWWGVYCSGSRKTFYPWTWLLKQYHHHFHSFPQRVYFDHARSFIFLSLNSFQLVNNNNPFKDSHLSRIEKNSNILKNLMILSHTKYLFFKYQYYDNGTEFSRSMYLSWNIVTDE